MIQFFVPPPATTSSTCLKAFFLSSLLCLGLAGTSTATWPEDGITLTPSNGEVRERTSCPDGSGGVLVFWRDISSSSFRAARVSATGIVDPSWPAGGLQGPAFSGSDMAVLADGSGGAFIAWETDNTILALHVLSDGTFDPSWSPDGETLVSSSNQLRSQQLVADGSGGFLLTWLDLGEAPVGEAVIHVLRFSGGGVADPGWPVAGTPVPGIPNADQHSMGVISDLAGGVVLGWVEDDTVLAQRILSTGVTDPAWPANGRVISASSGWKYSPQVVSDGSGGAILAWMDGRDDPSNTVYDVYVSQVSVSGVVSPSVPANGAAVSTLADVTVAGGSWGSLTSDNAGGAFLCWRDHRGADVDIYAHHILGSGLPDPSWISEGTAVSTAEYNQAGPRVHADAEGGCVLVWSDTSLQIVTALRLDGAGNPEDGWPVDGSQFWDGMSPSLHDDGIGGVIVVFTRFNGPFSMVRLGRIDLDATTSVPGVPGENLDLTAYTSPNPTSGPLTLFYQAATSQDVRMEISDAAGRTVRRSIVGSRNAGEHKIQWDGLDEAGKEVRSGVYFYRITTGDASASGSFVVTR